MAGGRTVPRIFILPAVGTLVVAVVGFIVTMVLNAFVFDDFDAYGEVPIPGSSSLHLPAGEATVSFHTQTIGSPSGGGLPVPQLGLTILPPEGIPKPEVTESRGTTTTANNDAHIRVGAGRMPPDDTYDNATDGNVNGYISPHLAFGYDSSSSTLVWVFAGLFAVGLLGLTAAIVYGVKSGKRATPAAPVPPTFDVGGSYGLRAVHPTD